jgi:hypothetical protein
MEQFPATVDFPSLPAPLAEKYSAESLESLKFRPFGTEQKDLAVDFSQTDLPELVSQILAQCLIGQTESLPARFWGDLSVGKRLECLLRLAAGAEKTAFSFPFKCVSCGQQLEIELTLNDIAEIQSRADENETVAVESAGKTFVFRKPLGRDQESWQELVFDDERTAKRTIFSSLQISGKKKADFGDELLQPLEELFDEADPLVNFNCRAGCFECRAENQFRADLLAFALDELRRRQWRLLYAVHRLAAHYHWSESEIFAVPHWRRQQYLSLITDKK